jgi:hypothetical protein
VKEPALLPSRLDDDEALGQEARRIRPYLETLVGRPYGRLPTIGYRGPREARIAGGWSQYLTLGLGWTRLVRITPEDSARAQIPTTLAHELAHRYAFDESVTTLRGLEVSARLAAEGDPMHAISARLELARLLVGAAMADALEQWLPDPIDAFFAARSAEPALARAGVYWQRLRARRGFGPDWAAVVYASLPAWALEQAVAQRARESLPVPFPRFALDSLHAAAAFAYTGADALLGRRRARVPVDATLGLWRGTMA